MSAPTSQPPLLRISVAMIRPLFHYKPGEPDYWFIAIPTSRQISHTFLLHGQPGSRGFDYQYGPAHMRSSALRAGVEIGMITEDEIATMVEPLRSIETRQRDISFDSQDWVIEAIEVLKYSGIVTVYPNVSKSWIKDGLLEDLERDEVPSLNEPDKQMYYDRLFPETDD